MDSDRQMIVDQILKAIDYGNLPRDEIERRLVQIIEPELNVPFNAEINKEKVDLCNSLLRRLYMQSPIIDKADIEDSKERVRKRVNAYRRRRNILWTAVRSIAAALILVVGLTMLNIIPPIRWFTGTSTDDEQQYIVQGHEISTQNIAKAIAEHNGTGSIYTNDYQKLKAFLNLDVGFLQRLEEEFRVIQYEAIIFPTWINVVCSYSNNEGHVLTVGVSMFENIEEVGLQFEQTTNGNEVILHSTKVYEYSNIDTVSYVWSSENTVYTVEFVTNTDNTRDIINTIMGVINEKPS